MDRPIYLTDDELRELTKRQRPSAQRRVLRSMGIESKLRADGSLVVLRAHHDAVMSGETGAKKKPKREVEPNWEALTHGAA